MDGAGVRLTRVFSHDDIYDFDPFLMLDAFDSTNPDDYVRGFPWHPHRGIETITYLLEGIVEHGDSLGNQGSIRGGDCQWMTAGSGIIHQEMPKASPRLWGTQLWLNMTAAKKMGPPRYADIRVSDIPTVQKDGVLVRPLAGTYQGAKGAFEGAHVKATYFDVEISPTREWSCETAREETVFVYILQGSARFGTEEEQVSEKHAVLFGKGDTVIARASEEGVRFLFLSAPPLREPIAWGGPIVMNTREELDRSFQDIAQDTFISPEDRSGKKKTVES